MFINRGSISAVALTTLTSFGVYRATETYRDVQQAPVRKLMQDGRTLNEFRRPLVVQGEPEKDPKLCADSLWLSQDQEPYVALRDGNKSVAKVVGRGEIKSVEVVTGIYGEKPKGWLFELRSPSGTVTKITSDEFAFSLRMPAYAVDDLWVFEGDLFHVLRRETSEFNGEQIGGEWVLTVRGEHKTDSYGWLDGFMLSVWTDCNSGS